MVVVFRNILRFIIQFKIYIECYHVHKWGAIQGKKGHQIFHKTWILALAKSVETFIMVSISDMPAIKYWQNLGGTIDEAN